VEIPFTRNGLKKYDDLDPIEAIFASWNEPGPHPEYHQKAKDEVRSAMPLLARALDRLRKSR
jgi:hypothetical protein